MAKRASASRTIVGPGGTSTTKDVTILGEAGIMTAVAGIKAGDVVVVNPPPGLIQGSQVQAIMLPAAAEKP